jgi:hypothetical protein
VVVDATGSVVVGATVVVTTDTGGGVVTRGAVVLVDVLDDRFGATVD